MLPALSHHETGNNHQNTEFHNSHTRCNALTYIHLCLILTRQFLTIQCHRLSTLLLLIYIANTHPSSLGMSGEPANFEPADLCSATHPCSLNTVITTVSLRPNTLCSVGDLCSLAMILLTANMGPADLRNEVHPCSHGMSNTTVNLDQ